MNIRIRFFFLLLLGMTFTNTFAQDCNSIRAEAIRLKTALSSEKPKTYYDYANFLGRQKVKGNNCINKDVLDTFYNTLVDGANKGSIRCAARLVMISQYALYRYPTDYQKAFNISGLFLKLAYDTYRTNPDLYNEFGWIIPSLYLVNYPYRSKDNPNPELAATVFELFKLAKKPIEKESDVNSFKQAKSDYNKVWVHAYLSGAFGSSLDYSKGITYASKVSASYRNNWIIDILKAHEQDAEFLNPAGLAFLGAIESKRWYMVSDTDDYSNIIYQANLPKIQSKALFEQSYQNIGTPLKQIIDAAYPDYSDINKKWEVINTSRLKEPDGYPQWEFLPKTEQRTLFEEALKGKESTLKKKEKFQVFKAMVESGQNKALLHLANAYKLGEGLFPIGAKAIETYKKALAFETLKDEAAFNLAQIYDGALKDVKVNWTEAAKYYKMTTAYNPKSYTMLGEMALFGVGGFEKSRSTAISYFQKAVENGDRDAGAKLEILKYIPHVDNEIKTDNYTLSIKNKEELEVRTISGGNSLSLTVSFDVPQGLEENTLRIFPHKTEKYGIKYGTWSPSSLLKGEGEETVTIYNSTFKRGTRQIGFFQIVGNNHNEESVRLFAIPLAVCFLPQKIN